MFNHVLMYGIHPPEDETVNEEDFIPLVGSYKKENKSYSIEQYQEAKKIVKETIKSCKDIEEAYISRIVEWFLTSDIKSPYEFNSNNIPYFRDKAKILLNYILD